MFTAIFVLTFGFGQHVFVEGKTTGTYVSCMNQAQQDSYVIMDKGPDNLLFVSFSCVPEDES